MEAMMKVKIENKINSYSKKTIIGTERNILETDKIFGSVISII